MKLRIGIMGSADDKDGNLISKKAKKLAYQVGQEIARHNCILVNGACGGIPYIASCGAKDETGMVIGVSPAENFHEHIHKYKFPIDKYDILFYTGFGFKGRNVVNVSNCDAIIVAAGHVGTLNEFTIGYDEGMIIGVIKGTGGIADFIPQIIKVAAKKTGAELIYDQDPHRLVKKIITAINKRERKEKYKIKREKVHKCFRCE